MRDGSHHGPKVVEGIRRKEGDPYKKNGRVGECICYATGTIIGDVSELSMEGSRLMPAS